MHELQQLELSQFEVKKLELLQQLAHELETEYNAF
jgi:hypothetical protein